MGPCSLMEDREVEEKDRADKGEAQAITLTDMGTPTREAAAAPQANLEASMMNKL